MIIATEQELGLMTLKALKPLGKLQLIPFGDISGNLTNGEIYTLLFTRSVGIFYESDFKDYMSTWLKNNVQIISLIRKGVFPENMYITVTPIVDNLTTNYLISIFNQGIEQWRSQYTPEFAMSTIDFVSIDQGSGSTVIQQKETEQAQKSALPGWAKDVLILGGLIVIGAVAINAIIKKI